MKKVEIYTWAMCPFCLRAKALLKAEGVDFTEHKIDGDEAARQRLKQQTGIGSVPQIFVEGKFIGGCDDLHQLYEAGEFNTLFGLKD